ncbi:alpha/beta hydrolase, partial [Gemmatimonadota bacterium]
PTWTSNGWKRGDPSSSGHGSSEPVSSYGAVDRILETLGDSLRFPKLSRVVVTGHSAGGQYTHRFAAGSRVEEGLPHLRFRYVVANPSTYLYLGPERAGIGGGGFGLPDRGACPDYNSWHYGLEELNPYMQAMSLSEIRDRLVRRDVLYLVGDRDTGSDMLDMSCGAMLQGPNRYFRGLTLFAYMDTFYPTHGHDIHEVAGIGHSSRGVYTSAVGRAVLFGW